MDDTTERKLLANLDNVKCTPKYSHAHALEARRSLRAVLGCKAAEASMTARVSTASFEFRNRRRAKADFVAVEGRVKRGAKDIHVKKPKAKKQGRKKPHFVGQDFFGSNSIAHGTGSSPVCVMHGVPTFPGDTAPTPATPTHTDE